MKKIFEEFDHLRYYKDECTEYLITKECEKGSGKSGSNPIPDFLPEIMTSCFAVLLFIKFTLLFLACLFFLFLFLVAVILI